MKSDEYTETLALIDAWLVALSRADLAKTVSDAQTCTCGSSPPQPPVPPAAAIAPCWTSRRPWTPKDGYLVRW